ncbi:serine/threonine protein kinase [Egbenema bharatensis]|uniref:serine/threonine protein kinase n=1 Tax=Egbenema bharatensis TaxID=3463334 RepID=UPI003A8A5D8D
MSWGTGQRLQADKYTIEGILGVGGFGITYLAKDAIGQPVVIKTLNETAKRDPRFEQLQQDFVNEALWLAKCAHPHIVKIHRVFQEGGLWCMVMEYIAGENLCNRVQRQGVLSEVEALRYVHQVGDALTLMHQNGLLHRDVKPENIMLRVGRSEVVLLDLGIAREFTPNSTQVHTAILSNGYAPIEQYEYQARRGAYSDVYGLAATLYFLLTGEVPKDAQIRAYSLARHGSDPNDSPRRLNSAISEVTNRAILTGMAVESADRPQSIQEWLALLPDMTTLPPTEFDPVPPSFAAASTGHLNPTGNLYPTQQLAPGRRSAMATLPVMPPPASPAPAEPVNKPWLRWLGITVAALIMSALTGSAIARWWFQQQATTRLATAQELQAEGRYEDCISEAQDIPGRLEAVQTVVNQCAAGLLDRAKTQAANSDFAQAIQAAIQVPAESTASQEAQALIVEWSDALLQQATALYQERGELGEAIELLQVIPDSIARSQNREETVQQWQTEWAANETAFTEVEQALEQADWYGAREKLNALTTPYWQNRASEMSGTANSQIAAIEAEEQRRREQAAQEAAQNQEELTLAAAYDQCRASGGNNGGTACQTYAELCEASGGTFVADANFIDCLPTVEPDKAPKEQTPEFDLPLNRNDRNPVPPIEERSSSSPSLIVPIPGDR